MGDRSARALPAGIAVLDGDGVVRWINQPWPGAGDLLSATAGSNLLALALAERSPLKRAVAAGIVAVIAGATSYVEVQYEAVPGRPMTVAIAPTRGGGAVLLHVESGAGDAQTSHVTGIAEHLTPRESEVLARMTAGLSNREIAMEFGIEYTTVRGHVQSVLAKLGARSRVAAMAAAYRSGLARETDLVFDRESSRGPRDKSADDVGGRRESEVM